jgi:hypothetical protein
MTFWNQLTFRWLSRVSSWTLLNFLLQNGHGCNGADVSTIVELLLSSSILFLGALLSSRVWDIFWVVDGFTITLWKSSSLLFNCLLVESILGRARDNLVSFLLILSLLLYCLEQLWHLEFWYTQWLRYFSEKNTWRKGYIGLKSRIKYIHSIFSYPYLCAWVCKADLGYLFSKVSWTIYSPKILQFTLHNIYLFLS